MLFSQHLWLKEKRFHSHFFFFFFFFFLDTSCGGRRSIENGTILLLCWSLPQPGSWSRLPFWLLVTLPSHIAQFLTSPLFYSILALYACCLLFLYACSTTLHCRTRIEWKKRKNEKKNKKKKDFSFFGNSRFSSIRESLRPPGWYFFGGLPSFLHEDLSGSPSFWYSLLSISLLVMLIPPFFLFSAYLI